MSTSNFLLFCTRHVGSKPLCWQEHRGVRSQTGRQVEAGLSFALAILPTFATFLPESTRQAALGHGTPLGRSVHKHLLPQNHTS